VLTAAAQQAEDAARTRLAEREAGERAAAGALLAAEKALQPLQGARRRLFTALSAAGSKR
jgi:hypothetical protein